LTSFREGEICSEYNFDHPKAIDLDYAFKIITSLLENKEVEIPVYDFLLHKRKAATIKM
jgi:uridine kinase